MGRTVMLTTDTKREGVACRYCGLAGFQSTKARERHELGKACHAFAKTNAYKEDASMWPCTIQCKRMFDRLGIEYVTDAAVNESRRVKQALYAEEKYGRVANLLSGKVLAWAIKAIRDDKMFWEAIEMHLLMKPSALTIVNYICAEYDAELGKEMEPASLFAGKSILVVDDENLMLRMARRLLRPTGITETPTFCITSELGQRELCKLTHDVLLTDWNLGRRNAHYLVSWAWSRHMPVVIWTGFPNVNTDHWKEKGVPVVDKVIASTTLIPALERAIEEAARRKAAAKKESK